MACSITDEGISCAAREAEHCWGFRFWASGCLYEKGRRPSCASIHSTRVHVPEHSLFRSSLALNMSLLSEDDDGFGGGLRNTLESLFERIG
jgi:hypothetical protein